ncbi:MAG: hypothetical protein DCC88_05020 [Spirobacillus cienkowskii]|jgi:hypothetical protein|uniref:Lipoprotein n=1 Tax=Spirobacillus cienkowskii TaxID=495820 RepID=A0A369KXQ5_9BACT|nr:MAG: hypothetical protein DCC88_05020 [Spirobacillus cienkowskii]
MKKAHTAFSRSLFLSVFTLVGCGFKGNTNMQTEVPTMSFKSDPISQLFGTPLYSDPLITSQDLVDTLSQAPSNIAPTENNKKEYEKISSLALKYVIENIAKSEATEIVRIQKFVDVLKEAGFDDSYYDASKVNEEKFIAIPFNEWSTGNSVDLSEYKTRTGINQDSKFKVYGTKNGELDKSTFAEGTVYLFTYKLKNSEINHSAIITVPDELSENKPLPLILYAHGGDSGVSFRNIAQLIQSNLRQGIVAAPSFPGEAICAITTLGGHPKNPHHRSCADANKNVATPLVKSEGRKSPLDEDVSSLIGVHNAITKLALNDSKIKTTSNTIIPEFKTKLSYLLFNSKSSPLQFLNSPQTLGIADSRGGATMLATIGRIGIYYKHVFTELLTSKEQGLDFIKVQAIPKLPLLSGAALYYTPSSLLMGEFAFIIHQMLRGDLHHGNERNMFPMLPDLNKNPYIANYRNAPADNHDQEFNSLAGWLAASDVTFLGPYVSVALQNWTFTIDYISEKLNANIEEQLANPENKKLVTELQNSEAMRSGTPSIQSIITQLPKLKKADETLHAQAQKVIKNIFTKSIGERHSAPGSIILLHATHDQVVPYSQSLIAKTAFDKVFDIVHNTTSSLSQQLLTSFSIPPVGVQLFAFQPENKYYAVPLNNYLPNRSAKCTTDNHTFNKQTNLCFSGFAHGDASFATSTLINQSVNEAAGRHENKLQSILTQGIPGANSTRNTLTIINNGYTRVKDTLSAKIDYLQKQENTANAVTKHNIRKTLITAQKTHDHLNQTTLKLDCNYSPSRKHTHGVCYLKNGPQFHRPLYLDLAQKDSLIDKKWDNTAATAQSPLTPSDVLTAWFASSAKEVLTK